VFARGESVGPLRRSTGSNDILQVGRLLKFPVTYHSTSIARMVRSMYSILRVTVVYF